MKKTLLGLSFLLSITPPLAASEIAIWYSCKEGQRPEKIVKELIQSKLISQSPYEGSDSVEYFQTTTSATAFGFKLVAVEGAELGSRFFHRAPGTGASSRIGLIVQAQEGEVWSALRERDIPAHASRAVTQRGPKVFVEAFKGSLPKSQDPKLAYTEITCYPEW